MSDYNYSSAFSAAESFAARLFDRGAPVIPDPRILIRPGTLLDVPADTQIEMPPPPSQAEQERKR